MQMMWIKSLIVASGAVLGAWLRWGLGHLLNPFFSLIPFGTLFANWLGCFLIGGLLPWLMRGNFPQNLRLFFITGFLASLTTFSTFTAEWFTLFTEKQFGWMLLLICAHLIGGFIFIFLGMTTTEGIFFTHE